ncbi:hypothetical protein PO909_010726 [Leuciscus waleckii]
MASHKQSFQCFDTITDDPPLKPSFPHGHCSATSFRGSSGSTRLEPLEDRGCYLCVDHQQAKTMASEASGAYSNPWYHFQTHPHAQQFTNRRPIRPEETPEQSEDHHHHHRHSRKIVLVKNSDPSFRRTIVLHRRSLRSFPLFMDEVSELMQCLIRKLYTLQGHKIDSVQSLLQCPSILFCVGREPFHPLLLDSFRKNSYDKLPRLNIKPRSSVCSDKKEAKRNVNFGLETKRSVIHPKCDSSNRSAGLSTSSEKLFPNRLTNLPTNSLPPRHRGDCPHTGENMMDDDIEKRVLVNQDGSLSMEMKVRFRLLHNETLHWSTEVKKSKSSFNESHIVPDDACSISHGSAESCSEADSLSAGEAEETYSTKCYQRHFEESHCQHCCAHCQEYDMWKNPVPPSQGSVRRIRSSSSSASSRRIVCKKASTDSMRTMSSEEYTEHVVEKATCIQQTIGQQGGTTIEQCTINHCCSRSEVRSVSPKTKSTSAIEDNRENTHASDNDENRPDVISSNLPKDQFSVQITLPVEEYERPISVVSSSSQILASLKEDQDDEDVDLPLSISRASRGQQEDEESEDEESKYAEPNPCSVTPCKSPTSLVNLSPRPPSKASSSGQSKTSRKFASPEVGDKAVRSEASASPKSLSGPKTYKCVVSKDITTPVAFESNGQLEDTDVQDTETEDNVEERAVSAVSSKSSISVKSSQSKETQSVPDGASEERIEENTSSVKSGTSNKSGIEDLTNDDDQTEERVHSSISIKSNISARSRMSIELSEFEDDEQDRAPSSVSIKSIVSQKSDISESASLQEGGGCLNSMNTSVQLNTPEAESATQVELPGERSSSSLSSISNISKRSRTSEISEADQDEAQENEDVQERASSTISVNSTTSARSRKSKKTPTPGSGEEIKERAPSVLSIKSNASLKSKKSKMEETENRVSSALSVKSEVSTLSKKSNLSDGEQLEERASSAISAKSNVSVRSKGSKMSAVAGDEDRLSAVYAASHTSETSNEYRTAPKETCKSTEKSPEKEERAPSAFSTKSNSSAKSKKSKGSDMVADIAAEDRDDLRSASVLSSKSNISAKSVKSRVSEKNQTEERAHGTFSAQSNQSGVTVSDGVEVAEERALSAMSSKSNASERLKKSNNLKEERAQKEEEEEEEEERASSALSAKTSISAKSKASKVSEVQAEELDAKDQEEDRASSALSANSNVSAISTKTKAEELDGKDQEEDRASSALSAKSNVSAISTKTSISAKSKASKVSEVQAEEPDGNYQEERASSAFKTSISAKSKASKVSEVQAEEPDGNYQEERASSALSAKSNVSAISTKTSISAKSKASKVSDVQAEEPDAKDKEEERASSALSAKSNISAKSKKSNASATDVNTDNKEKGDRVPSAMSEKSDISTKTSISAKSKASKVSEVQGEEPDEEESEVKAPSVTKSRISVRSNKSKLDENEISNEEEIQERAPSAVSAKSNSSVRSRASKVSEIIIVEPDEQKVKRATSSRSLKSVVSGSSGPEDLVNEDKQKEARTESALSSISNISARSNKSEDSKLISNVQQRAPSKASVTSKTSARSQRSNISGVAPKETGNTDTGDVRSSSAMSAKSCASEKSKHSERTAEEDDEANKLVERTTSSLSVKSTPSTTSDATVKSSVVPTKSNASAKSLLSEAEESDIRSTSVVSNTSAESKVSKAGVDKKANRSPSKLSVKSNVSTRSKKSKVSESQVHTATNTVDMELNRGESPVCDQSKVSHTENSNKYVCSAINKSSEKDSEPASPLSKKDTNQDKVDVASNKSSKTKYLNTSPANGSVRQSSPTEEIRPSSKASGMSVHTEITGQEKTGSPDVTHKSQSVCSKCSSTQQKRPISSASAKEGNIAEMIDRPESNISSSSSHLKVNGQKNDVKTTVVDGRNNKLSTRSIQKVEDNTPRCHSATLSVTSGNHLSPIPPKSPKKSKKPVNLLASSNDSMLSQTVPALDPREEHTDCLNKAAELGQKTQSCKSDTNVSDIKSEKSSKCRKRIGSDSSCHEMDEDMSELSPSCLPNASPTEVVNEWLRKIPSDTTLCDLGDEFHENFDSIEPLCTSHHVPSGDENKHETLRHGVTKLETQPEMEDAYMVNAEGVIDKKVAEGDHSQRGEEPKMFNSSVLVMKVLLSPKLDRCNSLPEVSRVYGRKLSTSAQGLLDCLANLQLLDFGSNDEDGKKEKYQELMSMLKSLWLCDPTDSEKTSEERNKHLDKEFKARSSSGVDVNSGSTGSGKSSVNDGTQAQINKECEGLDTLTKVQEVDETLEEEASETPVSKYDSASQAQWTPETIDTVEEKLKDVRGSDETIRNNDSPRELIETPVSSNKSSGNNNKETESDRQEDTSSSSAPTLQRGHFSKRLSQDPDPVWILNLLNKLEKQFMTNYVDAMAEFKVRWNLDDNEQLDAMISELQDEVRRRIQTSIDRELRKIQGRAGRPRPPKERMSRESTIQTEQKRRRLKVMRNQSIDPQPAKSDDDYTMTGTDFSDQRSDDEFCPCDTCLKKKMASKHVLPVEMMNSAPVMMDFDLRRILQIKKSSPTNESIGGIASESTASKKEGEHVGLQAVKEEDEKEGMNKEVLASSAQEIKEDYEKQESEEESNISKHLRKDVDEEQDEEQEQDDETDSDVMAVKESESSSKINDEFDEDVANDDISEFDDIMQAETAKEEATEEYTEEESEEKDETAYEEAVEEDDIAGNKTAEDGETTNYDTEEELNTDKRKTAEDGETAEGETVEEGETDEDKTLDKGQTPEAETTREDKITEDETGEGETVNDDTAEEDEVAENETAEDGQSAEDETGECETVNDDTAEEDDVAEKETTEDGQTAEDETEEGETVNDDTAEEDEVAENETAEDGQTAEDETGEKGETFNDNTAEEDDVDENYTAEDGQTAEDEIGEEAETGNNDSVEEHETAEAETAGEDKITEDETAEEGETVNDNTAEEDEVDENYTAEDGQTAEDETGEEAETGINNSVEEHETAENESAENGQTAEDETGEEVETGNYDTGEEHEAAENETAEDSGSEDGRTAEAETAEEDKITEDETAEEGETAAKTESEEDGQTAGEDDITEDETAEGETSANNESVEDAEDETTEDGDTGDDQTEEKGEAVNDGTVEECEMAENESVEDGQTAEAETAGETDAGDEDTADEGTAEAETEMSEEKATVEDGTTAEDKNAEVELAERKQTPDHETTGEETDKSQSDVEEDKESVSCEAAEEGDILSNLEDAECLDVLTNLDVVEDETSLKNKGDVVLDSVDDNGEETTGQPERREEDNEHEVEDDETREDESDDARESSCVEKDEVEELNGNEKGKLSDITEDTAEEEQNQTNETNDDSKDSEWESSENALQKQMTKSSMESQPGSFEEVHEELTKNQNRLNHLKANP